MHCIIFPNKLSIKLPEPWYQITWFPTYLHKLQTYDDKATSIVSIQLWYPANQESKRIYDEDISNIKTLSHKTYQEKLPPVFITSYLTSEDSLYEDLW